MVQCAYCKFLHPTVGEMMDCITRHAVAMEVENRNEFDTLEVLILSPEWIEDVKGNVN